MIPLHIEPGVDERLRAYVALLLRWNRRINLVSRGDEGQVWARHVLDSLRLVPFVGRPAFGVDLGSGAGLPGLVLAVATGVHFHLVEADRRKAAFLGEAARVTGAAVTVHAVRIEALAVGPAPLITARALAPLPALLDLALPHLAPGGRMVFPKGARAEEEIAAVGAAGGAGRGVRVRVEGEAGQPVLVIERDTVDA